MPARFSLRDLPGEPARVEKRGDPEALAREADALARLAGLPWTPARLAHSPGRLVSSRLPGAPRDLARVTAADARRLGRLLAGLHRVARSDRGGLWWWDAPARTLEGYRRRRAGDAEAALASSRWEGLAAAALASPLPGGTDPEPFRMLHGDLVAANVVWGPAGPGLVDWEFWRMGDPAEDLAYLVAVNDLPPGVAGEVLAGYGDPAMPARVDAWVAVVAADAAGWYLAQGMPNEAARAADRAARAGVAR